DKVRGGGSLLPAPPSGQWTHDGRPDKGLPDDLAMQVDVETFDLDRPAHPDADETVGNDQDDEACHRAPADGGEDAPELGQHLARIAFQQARGAADGLDGEDAG